MKRKYLPLLLAASLTLPHVALAQESTNSPSPRIIVTGEGQAAISPDLAIVSLSVMREAETAREALDQSNEAMSAVLAAMKEKGIAEKDLQTSGLQISPRYVYPQSGQGEGQPRIVAYQATNTLTVRVREIANLGAVIDQSVTLGVNQGGNITFTNANPSEAITEARKLAVQDAMAKAKTLAEAAGVSLGHVVELSEQSSTPRAMPIGAEAFRMAASDAVPVAAGENTYQVHVNVTFEIKK